MPKRDDIHKILIIGSGPIVIGQACEFDYSGAQACKVLRQQGFEVVLVNSNPATIMTDPEMADATYIEPINWQTVAKIIEKERPDALLPTMGGQTALNCALDLDREGVLQKFNVEMIGASKDKFGNKHRRHQGTPSEPYRQRVVTEITSVTRSRRSVTGTVPSHFVCTLPRRHTHNNEVVCHLPSLQRKNSNELCCDSTSIGNHTCTLRYV